MNLEQTLYKSILLVDLKNDINKAIELLSSAVNNSVDSKICSEEFMNFIQAKVFLAELLLKIGEREKAKKYINQVIEFSNNKNFELDLFDSEIKRAEQLIKEIK